MADTAVSENSGENRDGRARSEANLKPFQKGKSGNPGGRPKGLAKAVREVPAELLGDDAADGAVLLARIFWKIVSDEQEQTPNRIAAGKFLAERGWGKPAEFVPIEDADPLELSEQEAAEIAVEFGRRVDELAERRRSRKSA